MINTAQNIQEVEKEDVDLSSFELKDKLNDKLWNGGKLDILARRKMLTIARDFISKFEISDFQIDDVIMTGSLANYNWSEEYSDIDLHIMRGCHKYTRSNTLNIAIDGVTASDNNINDVLCIICIHSF